MKINQINYNQSIQQSAKVTSRHGMSKDEQNNEQTQKNIGICLELSKEGLVKSQNSYIQDEVVEVEQLTVKQDQNLEVKVPDIKMEIPDSVQGKQDETTKEDTKKAVEEIKKAQERDYSKFVVTKDSLEEQTEKMMDASWKQKVKQNELNLLIQSLNDDVEVEKKEDEEQSGFLKGKEENSNPFMPEDSTEAIRNLADSQTNYVMHVANSHEKK